ncbi:hypothetical protein BC833DRAFT_75708 [Globomyces pollinis-pini]|nr:hypothetical protein BC833DRAFT_75708 [Globomyces pollinis-pini]
MNNLVQTTARMNSIALRPFRKIKVRDHLGPGYKPNVLHCLQASRIVADEISVRLARRIHEINCVPKNFAELPYAKQVSTWYTQTCQELFEFTDEVEHLRVHPDHQTDYWPPPKRSFFSFFKSSKPDPIVIESLFLYLRIFNLNHYNHLIRIWIKCIIV